MSGVCIPIYFAPLNEMEKLNERVKKLEERQAELEALIDSALDLIKHLQLKS